MPTQAQARRWTLQDAIVGLLVVAFLAWAGVVYTGVKAVNGQLQVWRESTSRELTTIKVDIALVKSDVKAIRAWQLTHGTRAHVEAIEKLSNHEQRIREMEKDHRREAEKLNRTFPRQ